MFNKKLRQSIGFKFLIIVSAVLLTSTVVISALIAVNERAMLRHSLINKGNGLVSYLAKLSKDPLIMKDRIELDTIVNQTTKDEEVLYAVIQDASGNLLTSQYASIDYSWPRVKGIVSGLPKESKLKDIIATIKIQEGVIEVFTPITSDTDTIGKVTLGMSEHKIKQQVVKIIIFIVVLNLVVTIIIGAILFIASKKLILDPITKLIHATTRFAKGELTTRVEIKTTGEVQVLVESFNLMMEDLRKAIVAKEKELAERKQAEESLRLSEEKLSKAFRASPDWMTISTLEDGRLFDVNNAFVELSGFSREEALGKTTIELGIWEDPHERSRSVEIIRKEGFLKNFESKVRLKSGEVRTTLFSVEIFDLEGHKYAIATNRDITERRKAQEKLGETLENLRRALGGTVEALATTSETRDPYTAGHQRRVADLARTIAKGMGLPEDQVNGLRMAASIHDLGKISVPAEILSKPTKLSEIEFSLIKIHPQIGYDVLKDIEFPWPIARIVLEHHERINGSGYPNGLTGDQILLESKILIVADVVEAIASHRPYRPAYGIEVALEEIEQNKGILYDPEVVDVSLRLFREKGYRLT